MSTAWMNGHTIWNVGRKFSVISFHLLLPWGSSELIIGVKRVSLHHWCWFLSLWWEERWPGARGTHIPILVILMWFADVILMMDQEIHDVGDERLESERLAVGRGSQWAVVLGWEVLVRVRRGVCSGLSTAGRWVYVVWGMFGPFSDVGSGFYFPLCLDLIMESSRFCLIQ